MHQSTRRHIAIGGGILFLFSVSAASAVDDKEVIKQARGAYYGLATHHFVSFNCNVTPNWEALLQEQRKANPANADRVIKKLSGIRFTVSLQKSGSATITHTSVAATNDKEAAGLKQVYDGMQQMVTGFFDTWTAFMRTPPLPEPDGVHQLVDQGGQWLLSYKDGSADVVTVMKKDFVIRELKVKSPAFASTIQPQFTHSREGLILAGYQADYHSANPSEATQLQVRMTYQGVNQLQLPKKLNIVGSYGGSPFGIEVTFSNCKATKL